MTDRIARAREIAAGLRSVAATGKPGPGRVDGGVTFGRGKQAPDVEISFGAEQFDAMTDASVVAALRARWGDV